MGEHAARIVWQRAGQPFTDKRYSREHKWLFDEGVEVAASASPHIVPLPFSNAAAVDPEEALVAATASCHMLFFLHFAADAGIVVDNYIDNAIGTMAAGEDGCMAMTKIVLRPQITFGRGSVPDSATITALHEKAHSHCFIANSLKCPVEVANN